MIIFAQSTAICHRCQKPVKNASESSSSNVDETPFEIPRLTLLNAQDLLIFASIFRMKII